MKIATIVGARPQFIKAAALSRELQKNSDIEEFIVHTGQHFDANMSKIFFDEMDIPEPKHNLGIHSLGHGAMTGQMLEGIEKIVINEKPDLLLVYGDTNSTLAGALAAKKLQIKVAHVEAGLRSFESAMPEEINRILTDRLSDLLFCPTDTAIGNLQREGFDDFDCTVVKSGDVMQDAANYYAPIAPDKSSIIERYALDEFILCTLHRAENTDNPERLAQIADALNTVHESIQVFVPIHPRTRRVLDQNGIVLNAKLVEPVSYFDMIELLKHCNLVMTDSGGLQKEAYFFRKHCVTMRDQTEWVELLNLGVNTLVGASRAKILAGVDLMTDKVSNFDLDLYGNGKATQIIRNYLEDWN